jgi:hypothetical protein
VEGHAYDSRIDDIGIHQKEPPFLAAQLVVLVIFVALTILAAIKFRLEPLRAA